MKKYLIFLISIFCFGVVYGQKVHRHIEWAGSAVPENGRPMGYFYGANVAEDGIPLYQEVLDLDGTNKKVKIANPVFAPLDSISVNNYPEIKSELNVIPHYITSKGKSEVILNFVPIIFNDNHYEKLVSFDIEISTSTVKRAETQATQSWKSSSVLSSGHWVKIKTTDAGIYKITYDQLGNWGFTDPASVCLYGNGGYMLPKMNNDFYYDDLQQDAIYRGKDGSGNNCIFFYSTGTVKWNANMNSGQFTHQLNDYSDYAYYFLTDQGNEKNIETAAVETEPATNQVSTFDEHIYHDSELENLIGSGRHWYGEEFLSGQTRTFSIPLTNPAPDQPVKVWIDAAGRSTSSSKMNVSINGSTFSSLNFSAIDQDVLTLFANDINQKYSISGNPSKLDLKLGYSAANTSSYAWLDYITVNYKRNLSVSGELLFRDFSSVGNSNVAQFNLSLSSGSNLQVWDVTDYTDPISVPVTVSGNSANFKYPTDQLHEFVAFYPGADLSAPEFVGEIGNQNLHKLSGMDMVIISHPDFLSEANELAQFHQTNDQLKVDVVTPDKISNEFSGGAPDVAGIRNFIRMLYDQSGSKLKYVLLFGDGSYDNKNISGDANNYILTYQSVNSLVPTSSFVTDDFFVLLDDGEGEDLGKIDLGIGRIPANSVTEAKIAVDKIKHYVSTQTLGDWRNVICFIGDDEDSNQHMDQANQLAQLVNQEKPSFYTDKIYFDAYVQKSTSAGERYPDVTTAINKRVKDGALILNYTGHANETALAHEKVLSINDIDSWTNYDKLPIFVTATCEFSRFDAPDNSGGEHIFFNPNGGGIALFSTTRVVYSYPNFVLNKAFYNYIFRQDASGQNLRMGEVLKLAKNSIGTGINKRNFTLLGDPALSLAFPRYNVETESINNMPVGSQSDTINILSKVTIKGKIADQLGNTMTNFNGEVIPIVYDKEHTIETLGNGGLAPFTYKIQDNIVYKGVTTVTNGEFEFSFIVPKDISYAVGKGKISYYANNGQIDAHGYYNDFLIGGSGGQTMNDNQGPTVNLYLNTPDFKSGDEVGKTSVLMADIEDENGVNTVGVGIGHDITVVLDDDYSNILVLNDSYLSDKDSYKKGQLVYPLDGLSVGEHTLKLKVWDVLNNSTEVEIHFKVNAKLEISEVSCYPNPANSYTNIIFKHNRPDESFDTKVEIYDFSGNLVDVLNQRLGSSGLESLPLLWQINNSQVLIRSGAYLYRVIIVADDGYSASKTGKVIISRY